MPDKSGSLPLDQTDPSGATIYNQPQSQSFLGNLGSTLGGVAGDIGSAFADTARGYLGVENQLLSGQMSPQGLAQFIVPHLLPTGAPAPEFVGRAMGGEPTGSAAEAQMGVQALYGGTAGEAPPRVQTMSHPWGQYEAASRDLKLTPQEQFLYRHHLRNLMGPGKVTQPGGETSTVLQATVQGPDGRTYNIPTVWAGRQLPVPLARAMAASVGWDRWPSYANAGEAERRYNEMHPYMNRDLSLIGRGPTSDIGTTTMPVKPDI